MTGVGQLSRVPPFVMLVAAMALTGSNVPLGKVIVAEMPVLLFLTVRFAVASVTLLAALDRSDWQALAAGRRELFGDILILAGVGSALFTFLLLEGTKRTTASEAGIIAATLPAVVAGISIVVLRKRIGRLGAGAILLAVGGLAAVNAGGGAASAGLAAEAGASRALGNALVFSAILCEATFVLLSARASLKLSPIALSFAVSTASLVLALPFAIGEAAGLIGDAPDGRAHGLAVSPATWLLAVWYALSASVFCTILWYRGVGRVAAWQAGLATAAIPVAAIAVSSIVLGERLTAAQTVGALLVIAAIVAAAFRTPARRPRLASGPGGATQSKAKTEEGVDAGSVPPLDRDHD